MTKTCTRCKKPKPIGDYRMKDRLHQGRVKTCKDCEAQLHRAALPTKRSCACGTILARDNGTGKCGPCTKAATDARYGNPAGLIKVEQQLRERLLRFDREIERLTTVYASIADRPSPEVYLNALTDAIDGVCALGGVDAPEIADVFPREFVQLVTGETIGLVVSEGTGSLAEDSIEGSRLVCGGSA